LAMYRLGFCRNGIGGGGGSSGGMPFASANSRASCCSCSACTHVKERYFESHGHANQIKNACAFVSSCVGAVWVLLLVI
jgi:hypothetical protein